MAYIVWWSAEDSSKGDARRGFEVLFMCTRAWVGRVVAAEGKLARSDDKGCRGAFEIQERGGGVIIVSRECYEEAFRAYRISLINYYVQYSGKYKDVVCRTEDRKQQEGINTCAG
jgi:hypothetical protein